MPKKFYTERDIDALHAQGVTRLDVNTNTVITPLAKDRMTKLGMGINAAGAAQTPGAPAAAAPASAPSGPSPAPNLAGQVKAAVLARLGDQVDAALLDAIIARVLARA